MDGQLPLEVLAEAEPVVDPRRRWMYVQLMVAEVWKRWIREYLPLLNLRRRWLKSRKNVAIGDVVLSLTSTTPRGTWPLGRVSAVYPGDDGCVRVVDVDISGKTYHRSVHRLVPVLEVDNEMK